MWDGFHHHGDRLANRRVLGAPMTNRAEWLRRCQLKDSRCGRGMRGPSSGNGINAAIERGVEGIYGAMIGPTFRHFSTSDKFGL